jgi:ribonucleoside-diphosphate reductase alpha chain
VGLYPNGQPGELFVKMAKEGSTVSGLMDALGIVVSLALQHGVPLSAMAEKLKGMRFAPSGYTGAPQIRHAHSLVDYVARWLQNKFEEAPAPISEMESVAFPSEATVFAGLDNPPCPSCGTVTIRAGSCYTCGICGTTTGCG